MRKFKLRIVIACFTISDFLSITPNIRTAIQSIEVKKHSLFLPILWNRKSFMISPNGIFSIQSFVLLFHINKRRIVFKRIIHVYIQRKVVTKHFPTRRHVYAFPFKISFCEHIVFTWSFSGCRREVKVPLSIKANQICFHWRNPRIIKRFFAHHCLCVAIRKESSTRSATIDLKNLLIFPIILLLRKCYIYKKQY